MEGTGPELLLLACGDGIVAVPLSRVAEVGRVPRLTRLPGVPPFVAGLANWRGSVTTVLSLPALLGTATGSSVGPVGPRAAARLVVVRQDGWTVALLADGVVGLAPDAGEPQPLPPGLPPDVAAVLRGQAVVPAGPAALLDLAALPGLRERLPAAG